MNKARNQEIFEWLKSKKYQTEREETGEYLMYFELDMPKILEEYHQWKLNTYNFNEDINESLIDEAINDVMLISKINSETEAHQLIKTQFIVLDRQDVSTLQQTVKKLINQLKSIF